MFVINTDGRCPPAPEFPNALPDNEVATSGSLITYTCTDVISNVFVGTHTKSLVSWCNGKKWNVTSAACAGN